MIDFESHRKHFHPVIKLPADYDIYDFTENYHPDRNLKHPYGIGKFNEVRKGMYSAEIFGGIRNIHMGIDIGAPVGTEIYSFAEGEIYLFANNDKPGDYGYTLITKHLLDGIPLYALYGHLSELSLSKKQAGQKVGAGDLIAWVGNKNENGGWNPHLHFQLSYERPLLPDMPGAVSEENRAKALQIYVDPRMVLGPLY